MEISIIIIILYITGIILILLEMVTPGAIMGSIGIISSIIAIYLTFTNYPFYWGIIEIVLLLVIIPLMVRRAYQKFGLKTVLGDVRQTVRNVDETLKGKTGKALTLLRPSGIIEIDGNKIDALSDGTIIYKGESIIVTEVEGNRVLVRKSS